MMGGADRLKSGGEQALPALEAHLRDKLPRQLAILCQVMRRHWQEPIYYAELQVAGRNFDRVYIVRRRRPGQDGQWTLNISVPARWNPHYQISLALFTGSQEEVQSWLEGEEAFDKIRDCIRYLDKSEAHEHPHDR